MRIRTPELSLPARTLVVGLVGIMALPVFIVRAQSLAATNRALDEMVEAERSFARTAAEQGVRQAFLTFLAEDAISVQPYGNAKAQWLARPAPPPGAKTGRLEWEPRTGEVAGSDELGWLTGNFTATPPAGPPRHGCYFSVWERQAPGEWRVRLDVGIDTPAPCAFPKQGFVPIGVGRVGYQPIPGTVAGEPTPPAADLVAADRALDADATARGMAAALLERTVDSTRLHRPGHQPRVGREAIAAHFAASPASPLQFDPAVDVGIARTRDLGWTVGRYRPATGAGESGYYVRVWRRGSAQWWLAADITQPDAR